MSVKGKILILFVCMGNICRSPALEGMMRHLIWKEGLEEKIEVGSCAFQDFFWGSRPDPQIVKAAKNRGITIEGRATLFNPSFFDTYDFIFVVDNRLLKMLKSMANSKKMASKVFLATEFASRHRNLEMEDPYCGGEAGFEKTMDVAEDSCRGILVELML